MPFVRSPANPIITRLDVPPRNRAWSDVSSVFNPAAVRWKDGVLLLLRVQNRGRETCLMLAESRNGYNFCIHREPVRLKGLETISPAPYHIYDPRITPLEGNFFITLAMDFDDGCRNALVVTSDFENFQFLGLLPSPDSRNAVLFPAKIGGYYWLHERPNRSQDPGNPTSGDVIVASYSSDLETWHDAGKVISGRWRYWDERIGSGPPPVRIAEGWLALYHGVATHFASSNIYQVGAMVLDADDPAKVISRTPCNILEPREWYELTGQVPNVVFPGGLIPHTVNENGIATADSILHMYYGAADTCIGLAEITVEEILLDCRSVDEVK